VWLETMIAIDVTAIASWYDSITLMFRIVTELSKLL
jgi:hypothetical protein